MKDYTLGIFIGVQDANNKTLLEFVIDDLQEIGWAVETHSELNLSHSTREGRPITLIYVCKTVESKTEYRVLDLNFGSDRKVAGSGQNYLQEQIRESSMIGCLSQKHC